MLQLDLLWCLVFCHFLLPHNNVKDFILYFSGEPNISTTSLFVAILFFGSIQSLILGVLSVYIGSIFKEAKKRPLYIVESSVDLKTFRRKS